MISIDHRLMVTLQAQDSEVSRPVKRDEDNPVEIAFTSMARTPTPREVGVDFIFFF